MAGAATRGDGTGALPTCGSARVANRVRQPRASGTAVVAAGYCSGDAERRGYRSISSGAEGAGARTPGLEREQRVVLFNAGHDPGLKRLDLARQAVALVQDFLDDVRLEVLDGQTPPERVPELLNAADCLLLTSDREGSSTLLQEALACNLPVVSVNVGDSRERLAGVRHCAIVEREPAAIAAELARILRVPVRSNGREKVTRLFRAADCQRAAPDLPRSGWPAGEPTAESVRGRRHAPFVSQPEWNTSPY